MMADKSRFESTFPHFPREILAVQVLRNGIMTSTFFASTASVIGFYILGLALKEVFLFLLLIQKVDDNHKTRAVQYGILASCFLASFLNMAYSARNNYHASFLVTSKPLDSSLANQIQLEMVIFLFLLLFLQGRHQEEEEECRTSGCGSCKKVIISID